METGIHTYIVIGHMILRYTFTPANHPVNPSLHLGEKDGVCGGGRGGGGVFLKTDSLVPNFKVLFVQPLHTTQEEQETRQHTLKLNSSTVHTVDNGTERMPACTCTWSE